MFTLIVPVAGDKAEYRERLPLVFNYGDDGVMLCVKAVTGLNLSKFTDIIFVVLADHDRRYGIEGQLRLQFGRLGLDRARVLLLDEPTGCQAETIYRVVKSQCLEGAIFIKDGDCYFQADDIVRQNGVAIYPLEELTIVDPQHKSYVAVDDMNYVTNIIESRVVSHYFNAGGYCFEDAAVYCDYYERLRGYGHLYLSHVIYAMLLDRHIFRPIEISGYIDWAIIRHSLTTNSTN